MKGTVDAAKRMNRLLADLLSYTEISTAVRSEGQPADSDAALQSALANLETAIRESGAMVTNTSLPRST
jgi:light-regulated signal transduction histidine kinase (bacteriophytochrome)